jgi:hypothetical protein
MNGVVAEARGAAAGVEKLNVKLNAGTYVLEIFDDNNISFDRAPESLKTGVYCQQVSITPLP